eukprot:CAMPEP_0117681136 /NCGR_PEP_ID=MMETSP0804-20121206/18790_1 /TAXON_ID=1074897 /ORGANISM="Tetraselmis astigmatica, Strain CCMP880" /LENGTH=92 /DNA_ID=CAMNT_0005490811 /DNA_START=201 /DNA_END=479 /DNA_ORIENTATION=+
MQPEQCGQQRSWANNIWGLLLALPSKLGFIDPLPLGQPVFRGGALPVPAEDLLHQGFSPEAISHGHELFDEVGNPPRNDSAELENLRSIQAF